MYLVCTHEYDGCTLYAIWDNKELAIAHAKRLFIESVSEQRETWERIGWKAMDWTSAAITHYGVEWIAFNTENMDYKNNVTIFSTADVSTHEELLKGLA